VKEGTIGRGFICGHFWTKSHEAIMAETKEIIVFGDIQTEFRRLYGEDRATRFSEAPEHFCKMVFHT
jgi:hypothetical protein